LGWGLTLALSGSVAGAQQPALDGDEASETAVATADVAGVPASVELRNEVGQKFRLIEARVTLDGRQVAHLVAPKGQELPTVIRAYDGQVDVGPHRVSAVMVYEGRNRGPFTYLDNYRFRAESEYRFGATASKRPAALNVVSREVRGATKAMEDRLEITFSPAPGSGLVAPATAVPTSR